MTMKPGRNDPCPCGSAKKYKRCCQEKLGAHAATQVWQQHAEAPRFEHLESSPAQTEFDELTDLSSAGCFEEVESRSRSMLERYPNAGFVWKMLGQALRQLNRESLDVWIKAATFLPHDFEAHYHLARLFYLQGNFKSALNSAIQSLSIKETTANKSAFVSCVKHMQFGTGTSLVKDYLIRALTEPWDRPTELSEASTMLIKLDPVIQECMHQMIKAWPQRLSAQDLFQQVDITGIAGNKLLLALIGVTPVCDVTLELLLTACRQLLLDKASARESLSVDNEDNLDFYGALARQCFINEYVFAQTSKETQQVSALRDALVVAMKEGVRVPALWPLAIAAYSPLGAVPYASRLFDSQWPEAVNAVLIQQVREPQEEQQERASINRLTDIEDDVSQLVQNQYEENPYPRWTRMAPAGVGMTVDAKVRQLFPTVSFKPIGHCPAPEVLIAGCGTGYHSIESARQFIGARVLAIDLSISSLAYARRKTREMGLTSIEYAQADIMKLGSLKLVFDVIESCGVLHHLADPWVGWRNLLSLLRPGGFMRVALYSELARRDVVRARAFIAEHGYSSRPEDIRRCRQDMLALTGDTSFATIYRRLSDFYTTSNCRDLLFHVHEHRMTLPEIEAFIRQNGLAFLGFEIKRDLLQAYIQRFPNDISAIDLGQWHAFEIDNPDTFAAMYIFWVQKAA
jgi:2-polyprenyl-3-methyl-5-hydroxy-6-metoxy-1,4-benzoquinol methylase